MIKNVFGFNHLSHFIRYIYLIIIIEVGKYISNKNKKKEATFVTP